jgi:uncharacterized protein YndB with AHSA1/START domain
VPQVYAQRELLASREDVWRFLAEPHHLADWWPGVTGVEPDRRGLAPAARWRIVGTGRPSLLRKPDAAGMLIVLDVAPPERLTWQFTADRVDVALELSVQSPDRTVATLRIEAPWFAGLRRSLPRRALNRLQALIQTTGEL